MTAPYFTGFRGSVNRWECDENDHQNVRHILAKFAQANANFCVACGLSSDGLAALNDVRMYHVRFLQEARVATPITVDVAALPANGSQRTEMVAIMKRTGTDSVLATLVSAFDAGSAVPRGRIATDAPQDTGPRGVPAEDPHAKLELAEALELGFFDVGAGVVLPEETIHGVLPPYRTMARISDAVPNLWAEFEGDDQRREQSLLGGAVLEMRLHFHDLLPAGAAYRHLAGVAQVSTKTNQLRHLLYRTDLGEQRRPAVTAIAVSITMDLANRRSIPIPADRRARLVARAIDA